MLQEREENKRKKCLFNYANQSGRKTRNKINLNNLRGDGKVNIGELSDQELEAESDHSNVW